MRVAQPLIERQDRGVGRTYLHIQLRTSHVSQLILNPLHQHPSQTTSSALFRDRHVVNPTPVPIEPGHDCCDDASVNHANKEQLRLNRELPSYVFVRVIPRPYETTLFPEAYD